MDAWRILDAMKVTEQLNVSHEAVAALCRRHHIRRLAVFGSTVRGDQRPDSDVDVLVEFEPGHTPGLAFFRIQEELTKLFGRNVDLNTPEFLNSRIRERVQAEAEVLFAV